MSAKLYTFARLSVACLIAAATVACGDSADPSRESVDSAHAAVPFTNASTVNSSTIPELNLAGVPNEAGQVFSGVVSPDGQIHRLDVIDGEFVGRSPKGAVAHGDEMVGWTIRLMADGAVQEVLILGYEPGPASVYALAVRNDEGDLVNLCPAFADSPEQPAVTLIGGERYDAETKEVIAEQESWVTLACRNDALFKMKEMGYVPDETKAIHRQATLKMLTADYCGSGHSFTADGTPLIVQNFSGTVGSEAGKGEQIEALWNEHGALCLSAPRLATLEEIAEHCTLPACDDELLAKGGEYEWTTWIP